MTDNLFNEHDWFCCMPHLPDGHNVPVKLKLQLSPPPPSPGQKPVQMPYHRPSSGDQMPPPPGKLPDYCFKFSVASIMPLKLCM